MNEELHRKAIYPVTRVHTDKSGGSGTIIYSKPKRNGKQETFILTNHHVIEDAIHVREEWDSYLARNRKREYRDKVGVTIFRYIYGSKLSAGADFGASIEAYQQTPDIALLKLEDDVYTPESIAEMFPKVDNPHEHIHYGDGTIACGCSLGHPTVVTEGHITSMNDEIENYDYWMSTAQTIFGNSGGAVFLLPDYKFIGIPSRLPVIFIADAITHMGFFIPIHRIYNFLEEELYQFIYDQKFTSEQCTKMREDKKRQAELAIERMRQGIVEDEKEEDKQLPDTDKDSDH